MSFAVSNTIYFDRPIGQWSDYISVTSNGIEDCPAQYFMCGVQFKQRSKEIIYSQRNPSDYFQKYYEMTNAVKIIFCRATNWSDQI